MDRRRDIYVIRHGATGGPGTRGDCNRIHGWDDTIQLTEDGRREVEMLGFQLAGSGIKTLYASDLGRTRETAKIIAKSTGAKVVLSPQLRSWNLGEFTGMDSQAARPQLLKYAMRKPNMRVPGGEAFCEFVERAAAGLRDAINKFPRDYLALVTHYRYERWLKAWIAAGCPVDMGVDFAVMFADGESTAHAEKVGINCDNLLAGEFV